MTFSESKEFSVHSSSLKEIRSIQENFNIKEPNVYGSMTLNGEVNYIKQTVLLVKCQVTTMLWLTNFNFGSIIELYFKKTKEGVYYEY